MPSWFNGDLLGLCGRMHLFIAAYAHPAWGLITFTQSRGPRLSPYETPPRHNGRKENMLRSYYEALNNCNPAMVCNEHTEFTESLKSAQRMSTHTDISRLILFISMSEVEAHAHTCGSHMQWGPYKIQRSRKRHRKGSTVDFLCRYSHLQ